MKCYKCGWELGAFETTCPRCSRQQEKEMSGTQRLDDPMHQTMHLVQIDQCPSCRWIVFPSDTHCSSCGAAINRPKKSRLPKQFGRFTDAVQLNPKQQQILFGVATGAAVVAVVGLLVFFLKQ